ncbi:hypothetical protein AHAS_Ahas19G0066800 [Arachis hypogaea]
MEASDFVGNDPEQPCLTSELQPPRNMDEANWKNDDHDTNALNLDLTMDVPLLNVASQSGILVEEFILPSAYKSSPPTSSDRVQDEAMDKKIAQPPNTPGCVATADAVVLNNSNIGAPGLMFTHQLTSSQKGKGILGDPITNLSLDVVVLDSSSSEDDLVLLDHLSSTPVISTGATLIPTEAPTNLHWSRGVSKMWNELKDDLLTPCNAIVQKTKVGGDFDSTTRLCDLYASSEPSPRCSKMPRLSSAEVAATIVDDASMGSPPKTQSNSVPQRRPLFWRVERGGRGRILAPNMENPIYHIPKNFAMWFRPIADMSLTRDECHLGTYIFAKNEEMRETENLFKHYELTLPHGKFLSLRPECMPHFDVVKTVAMLSYLQAKANPVPRCWFFPSAFAAEILFQTLMEHVIESYARRWMPPTQELEHRPSVYALDVCTSMESVPRCERNMCLIMAVLENIFKLEPNLPNFKHGSPDPNTWGRIEYPMSIPSRLGAELKALVDLKAETVCRSLSFLP